MSSYTTSFDSTEKWQLNESGIAIMPLGATEQHGHHLPLNTDTLTAEYFAEYTAKELGAMLLPAMPFGTSLEHAGFRGSISLKPEVLIAFIQNIADELEAQNIKIFIIMNGHGGNFAMGPAVRQINRADRKIKILIVNCWEFQYADTIEPEVHGGEGETSLMLGLHKNLVHIHKQPPANPSLQEESYKQSDLNTFGLGRMHCSGIWGNPCHATEAKGKKQITDIKKNMLPFIRERIRRLNADSRYAGAGPTVIRKMTTLDIPAGMVLKNYANWNQTNKDWDMLLDASKEGNYVALKNGEVAGTVTTVNYSNRFSWVGMVLVDPKIRRSGIGKMLLNASIEYAKTKGTVRLDATPDGKKLYDTLGFKDEYLLSRMQTHQLKITGLTPKFKCERLNKKSLNEIFKKDSLVFGADRKIILQHLFKNKPELACVCYEKNKIVGYCFGRAGQNFTQIGPLVADSLEVAQSLLLCAFEKDNSKSYIVDTLDDKSEWSSFLKQIGFQLQRPFIRMYLGAKPKHGQTKPQYLIAGPELG